MYTQIGFKTDYSLLSSLLKTKDIIKYAENIKAKYIGILILKNVQKNKMT